MIGVYDYTVILTYLSAASATAGILISLSGSGHPIFGIIFLMLSGVFDAFDGKVARMKKDRSEYSKKFGIQLDSLVDIIAFGILPVCIGASLLRQNPAFQIGTSLKSMFQSRLAPFIYIIMVFYVIAGVIRLANYNVKEEQRQSVEDGNRKYFEGLPITAAAVIFPFFMPFQFFCKVDLTIAFFVVMLLTAFAFIIKIKIPKPKLSMIILAIVLGIIEYSTLIIFWNQLK